MNKNKNKIKVGGITYKIELADPRDMGDDLATTDFDRCLIKIDRSIDDSQKGCALIHEIFHCINNQLSEKEVEFFAMAWYQILVDNPHLKLLP